MEGPMTQDELNVFLAKNNSIECNSDDSFFYFRNRDLPWYANNPGQSTRITNHLVAQLSSEELMNQINKGLEVEQITRITGYFTKISQWNKGKRGELKDRFRVEIS
jgi:hypothetical protein